MWRVCTVHPHVPFLRDSLLCDDIGLKAPAATEFRESSGVYLVQCYYFDYDGERVIPVQEDVDLAPFTGRREIRDLDIYPARFLPDLDKKVAELKHQGELF